MTDYTLKFQSEAEANAVLFTEQIKVDGDVVETFKTPNFPEHAIDIIGLIYKPTGEMLTTEDGLEQPVMAAIAGWHVNVRGEENETLAEYHVNVRAPVRMWA